MNVCSYTMECEEFENSFVEKKDNRLNELFDNDGLHAYFPIPSSKEFYIKFSYSDKNYHKDLQEIKNILWIKFILASLLLFVIALIFTFYSLHPIRKALTINDEFIKDILHDFNTPITSMILNIKMFREDKGENIFIKRIAQNINSITLLQNNLKSFLQNSPLQNSEVDIASVVKERFNIIKGNYPKLIFEYHKKSDFIYLSNKELLTRIFDNILSNAAKYNKPQGKITVTLEKTQIIITDTGKGIKNINKVIQRYYSEQERGIGLGLHIVKKLVDELNIIMTIHSKIGTGTTFTLDFKDLKKI